MLMKCALGTIVVLIAILSQQNAKARPHTPDILCPNQMKDCIISMDLRRIAVLTNVVMLQMSIAIGQ